jgi:hypothetical protein
MPSITAINDTNHHIISVSLIDIKEVLGKTGATGYGTYSIRTNYSSKSGNALIARAVNITVFSDYTAAWTRYFQNMLNASSLTNFTVVTNETEHSVTVTIDGPQSSDRYDVDLSLDVIGVYAQIGPGWVD